MPKLPDPFSTKPTKEQINLVREITDKVFRDPNIKYGLKEFANLKIDEILNIFEKEKGKFYNRLKNHNSHNKNTFSGCYKNDFTLK